MSHASNSESNSNNEVHPKPVVPNPEVIVKPRTRHFTTEYKQRILQEAEACARGERGALLRREGLYSSHITNWRRQRASGEAQGLTPQKRGRKSDPQAAEIAKLKRENENLKIQLQRAETIIDVQKKLSQLLGLTPDESNGTQ